MGEERDDLPFCGLCCQVGLLIIKREGLKFGLVFN